MPMSSIESANVAVKKVMLTALRVTAKDDKINDECHGTYQHFTSKDWVTEQPNWEYHQQFATLPPSLVKREQSSRTGNIINSSLLYRQVW